MQLIHGDCLEKMNDTPDKSIDMILCDLPYGTTACKWDVVIPFEPLWEQYKRIIKDRGAIVLFGSEPFSSMIVLSNLQEFRYNWIWHKNKSGNTFQYKNSPMKRHESISVFSSGGIAAGCDCYYYPDTKECRKKVFTRYKEGGDYIQGVNDTKPYIMTNTGYPESILKYPVDSNRLHPTQKPVALLEYLIKTYTLKGETVLDNCMGSGSTGVACINTRRNFIGIEKDDKYFEIAKKRIEEHLTTASA